MPRPDYEVFRDNGSLWMVHWPMVRSILRSNANQWAQIENGRTIATSQVDWFNPFSWSMPDVVTYEVDWAAQRLARERHLATGMREATTMAPRVGYAQFHRWLRTRVEETEAYRRTFRENLRNASSRTMQNIESSVDAYGWQIDGAKLARDVSADAFLVGATFLTGGAAAGAVGVGSVAKGLISYQDKGDVGLAVVETTGEFVVNLIPLGRVATGGARAASSVADEAAVVFLSAQFDLTKALINGDSFDQALARTVAKAGASKAAGAVLGQVAKMSKVQDLVRRLPIPARVRVTPSGHRTVSGPELAGSLFENRVTGTAGSAVSDYVGNQWTPAQRAQVAASNRPVCTASEEGCAQREMLDLAVQRVGSM